MARVWFTADNHFGHERVIKYARRPFRNVDEMDAAMVRLWNAVVRPEDTIYHLGDVSFYRDHGRTRDLVSRLPGHKHLVFGNHDKSLRKQGWLGDCFESVQDMKEVKVDDPTAEGGRRTVVLCHYAMRVWNRSHYGSFHFYGHSHGSMEDDRRSRSTDVGVDCWNFQPVSYETLRDEMSKKLWKPIDHHGKGDDDA